MSRPRPFASRVSGIAVLCIVALSLAALGAFVLGAAGCRSVITQEVVHIPDVGELSPGQITTFAGTGIGGFNAISAPRNRTDSQLYWPADIAVRPNGDVYVVDWNNHVIRVVRQGSNLMETVAGGQKLDDGTVNTINHPTSVQFTQDGTLLIVAWHNHQIRRRVASDTLAKLYGTTQGYSGNGSQAFFCKLNLPTSATWGADSTLYIADEGNRRIRMIKPTIPSSTGGDSAVTIFSRYIYDFAGLGDAGFTGDGGPAASARFDCPIGTNSFPAFRMATSDDGHWLYICDTYNQRVRRIDLFDPSHVITTIAGSGPTGAGNGGFAGDGGPATQARLSFPADVEIDADGSLIICDTDNGRIRKIDPSGTITTIAGNGQSGFSGDGGQATAATFNHPNGIGLDRVRRLLYVADQYNHRIRVVRLP